MDRYFKFHPLTLFSMYAAVSLVTLMARSPLVMALSFSAALLAAAVDGGLKPALYGALALLPLLVLTIALNMVFAPGTMFYGAVQGGALCSLFLWSGHFAKILTPERLAFLLGRNLNKTAMVLSMAFSFMPRLRADIVETKEALFMFGYENPSLPAFGSAMSKALEDAAVTADSMAARGYGEKKRSNYKIYGFGARDGVVIFFSVLFACLSVAGRLSLYSFFAAAGTFVLPVVVSFMGGGLRRHDGGRID